MCPWVIVVESCVFVCVEQCWLYSLRAAGRKDLQYRSFTHLCTSDPQSSAVLYICTICMLVWIKSSSKSITCKFNLRGEISAGRFSVECSKRLEVSVWNVNSQSIFMCLTYLAWKPGLVFLLLFKPDTISTLHKEICSKEVCSKQESFYTVY